jgi:FkbM family methyltransferase
MKQHFQDNGVDPEQHELIEAAVDECEHTIRFYVGKPDEWYGQRIAQPEERIDGPAVRDVKTITLTRILGGLDLVDLIDLDVEGAELVVLRSAIEQLNQKVKRVHIGTHASDIEQGLRALFWEHGWYKRNDYAVGRAEQTEWGEIYFENGVQTWINPSLLPVQPTLAELKWLQWAIRSSDFRYGNLQDELRKQPDGRNSKLAQQLQGWEKHWQSVENSAGWRLLTAWRRVRDRLGPAGTRRRRLYDSVISRFRPVHR